MEAMDIDTVAHLGPLVIAVGTFVEGETALLLAGAGLAVGALDFWTIVAAAIAGSLAGDQFFFWLGRMKGSAYLNAHPRFGAKVLRSGDMLVRHRLLLLCTYRFIYGLRGVIPFAFGVSNLCWRFFLIANLLTAALWSVLITLLGMHAARFLTDPSTAARLPLLGAGAAILIGLGFLLKGRFKTRP